MCPLRATLLNDFSYRKKKKKKEKISLQLILTVQFCSPDPGKGQIPHPWPWKDPTSQMPEEEEWILKFRFDRRIIELPMQAA